MHDRCLLIPALYGSFKVVLTNASPILPYRGAGRPDIAYAVERLVDRAADELKIDRAELRRRNFIPPDAFPYKSPTGGSILFQSDFPGCLDQAPTSRTGRASSGGARTR